MAVAGSFCVLGILVLQLQSAFSSPTCICNGNSNRNNPKPIVTLQSLGNSQVQTINQQQNIGQAIGNQLRLKEISGQNIGQSLGQNNIASLALALQQPNALQALAQQPSNAAPLSVTTSNVAQTRPTITLLDPATTAAFKSFLSSRSGSNVDQSVGLPGQTRLPLSSLPITFINKCQNAPDVLAMQNQQQSLVNIQPQVNTAHAQKSLSPLQGYVSMESLLNLLSNLQNLQATPVTNQNPVPAPIIKAVPAMANSPTLNQLQNPVGQQNLAPPLLNNPVPNSLVGQAYVSAPQPQIPPPIQSQSVVPTMVYPQGQMPNQQYMPTAPSQPIESPIQSANTNLQKLLPLLFDLVKENEGGCHSCTCPCHNNNNFNSNNNNYATQQPNVNSGYANQITYGHTDKTDIGETENEVFESLGSLRERLKLWKTKNDSGSDADATEQKIDTEDKDLDA